MTALSALVPVKLFTVGSGWAVHFLVLTIIFLGVEVPILGGASVLCIGFPFAVWVDTSWVRVVLVLGGLVEVLPEITHTAVDRVPVGVEVHVPFWVTLVMFPHSTLTLSFVVTCVTFTPRVVVAVTFNPAVIWITLVVTWRCFGWLFWIWGPWVSHTASFISPQTGVIRMMIMSFASWTGMWINVTCSAISFVCVLPGNT